VYRSAPLKYSIQWSLTLVSRLHEINAGDNDDHEYDEHIHLYLAQKHPQQLLLSSSTCGGGEQRETNSNARFANKLPHFRCSSQKEIKLGRIPRFGARPDEAASPLIQG
jgi:hypothetical protein